MWDEIERAIAVSTSRGESKLALLASCFMCLSKLPRVFRLLPLASKYSLASSILRRVFVSKFTVCCCLMHWTGSSVRIYESLAMWLVLPFKWLVLDRAPALGLSKLSFCVVS